MKYIKEVNNYIITEQIYVICWEKWQSQMKVSDWPLTSKNLNRFQDLKHLIFLKGFYEWHQIPATSLPKVGHTP